MSLRIKLGLIFFGLLIGTLPLIPVIWWMQSRAAATHFSSLASLRKGMLARDERDIKDDRSVSLRSIIAPHGSDEIIFDLLPDLAVKFQGVPLTTNRCGIRGPERAVSRPESVFRIALLGDSFAFGWGVPYEDSFAHLLERRLEGIASAGTKVEVINLGVPGYSTFQELAHYRERGADYKPDLVLLYFVENDFGLPFFLPHRKGKSGLLDAFNFSKLSWRNTDEEVEEEQKFLEGVLNPNRAIQKLYEDTEAQGIPLVVALNPSNRPYQRKLSVLRKNHRIYVTDFGKELDAYTARLGLTPRQLQLPKDPHPSILKHKILAAYLTQAVMPFLPD